MSVVQLQFTTLISFVQSLGHAERPPEDAAGPGVIFVFAHGQPLDILPGLARRPITVKIIVHQDVHFAERVLQSDGLVRGYGSDQVSFVEGVDDEQLRVWCHYVVLRVEDLRLAVGARHKNAFLVVVILEAEKAEKADQQRP